MTKVNLFDRAYRRNPQPVLDRIVADGPFHESRLPLIGNVLFVTRYKAVTEFLKDADRFVLDGRNAGLSSQFGIAFLPKTLRLLGQNMLTMDDPDHRRQRKLADAPFRTVAIEALQPGIARIADGLLDEMAARRETDLVAGFCRPFPLLVICELLGLPEADRPRFTQWMSAFARAGFPSAVFTLLPSIRRIAAYLRAEAAAARADGRPGLITALARAEADGDRLSEDELVALLFLLFVAGHETTTHLISGAVLALLEHPAALAALRADWSLAPAAVEEALRFLSPVQMTKPRYARADTMFHGRALRRGDRLIAHLAAANMDPEAFPDPARFDIQRPKPRHVAFGGGPHLCLGVHLARAEARIGLERLFTRWPSMALAVERDALRWTKHPGIRGLRALPLRPGPD